MRPLALLTNPIFLFGLQQAVAIWFLVDFFLARDSSTATSFRKDFLLDVQSTIHDSTLHEFKRICPNQSLEDPTFDKVILIVVDALGSEFIPTLSSKQQQQQLEGKTSQDGMPFVEQSIRQNKAIGFVAKAATPTVTMPRIKALLSGTIPSFMDVVYNLATDVSNFNDDNVLRIARANNKSLVFYGDDTWLSLFPRDIFLRVKETSSFFASDYTSVDTNVTEMALPEVELAIIDWDYLLLHYLGLDHIGHLFGYNRGPMIQKKLLEMDNVIQRIHDIITTKNHKTLIIICGDHGMSAEGNHGGDSDLEANTALLFMPIGRQLSGPKPKLNPLISKAPEESHVHQVDLAVTLSLLTGLPIPNLSRGLIIKPLLESLWTGDERRLMCASFENVHQLSSLADQTLTKDHPEQLNYSSQLSVLMRDFLNKYNDNSTDESNLMLLTTNEYYRLAYTIQNKLTETAAAKRDPGTLVIAIVLVVFLSLVHLRKSCLRLLLPLMPKRERLVCLLSLSAPIVLQGSTDFIELECFFWPLYSLVVFSVICLVTIHYKSYYIEDVSTLRVALFSITFLITATWNYLDILKGHSGWIMPALSVLILCNFSRQTSKMSGPRAILFYATGLAIFGSKMFEEESETHEHSYMNLAIMQIVTLSLILVETIVNIIYGDWQETSLVQKLATSWMWLAFLLARSRNFVYLISNVVLEVSVNSIANSLRLSPITRTVVYIQFATNAFYGQGNTNLFSSLDVKPAFYGQTRYNLALAIPLVACATFATQIYWYIKLFQRIQGEKEQERMAVSDEPVSKIAASIKSDIKSIIVERNFLSLSYYMFVCCVLKNHLFIWSVISPKLIYHYLSNLVLQLVAITISIAPLIIKKVLSPAPTTIKMDSINLDKLN